MRSLWSCVALAAVLPAQSIFHGNGVPSAYIANTPGVLGQQLTVAFGSPTAVLPIAILGISDGAGPVFVPGPHLGNIGLDLLSPAFQSLTFGLDVFGNGGATLLLPLGYPLASDPPLFMVAATLEATGFSISKTVRIEWANPNGWEPVGTTLAAPRQMHSATPLGSDPHDNTTEVLICGGATGSLILPTPLDSVELYDPLFRMMVPLPAMSMPRSLHRAVRLLDGRVLITGGVTTGGLVTATCEFFDPATRSFSPAPTMTAPRAGHALTLLYDGRVFVSGGVADWQNAGVQFIAALNSSQDSAEVFDPATNAWTSLPNMASRRLGHSQTRLLDGRVLIVSGIFGGYPGAQPVGIGGQIPRYTTSCEIFDPFTSSFAATAPLTLTVSFPPFSSVTYNGRAFHGASVLPNGDVLLTGGFVAQPPAGTTNDETIVVPHCSVFQYANLAWGPAPPLPAGAAFHGQEAHGNGAIVCGGFSGPLSVLATTAQTVFHNGAIVTPLQAIGVDGTSGVPLARGAHSFTPLYDGTFLVYGGGLWPNTLVDGWIYTPN